MPSENIQALPLQGRQILVTRTREQAAALSARLRTEGAIPVEFPTISIVPPADWGPLDSALQLLANAPGFYSWLVFTSANGVRFGLERLRSLGYDPAALTGVRLAAIGPATAAALAAYGLHVDLVPEAYIAEEVAAALIAQTRELAPGPDPVRVLLPRAAEAREVLVTNLQQAGLRVDEVAAYQTLTATSADARGQELLRLLRTDQLDLITFTSSSTVRNFLRWLEASTSSTAFPGQRLGRARIACIGPITASTVREAGLEVAIEARVFTIDGLVEAIVADYASHQRSL